MAAKKGGLGKGLDSLLVNKVSADHSSDSTIVKEKSTTTKKKSTKKETPDTMVKLSLVEPNREQPRKHFDEDGLLELARIHQTIRHPAAFARAGKKRIL